MKENTMSNLKEIKREPRNKEVIELFKDAIDKITEIGEGATEAVIMIKIDNEWNRWSTGVTDLVQLVGVLELIKHDSLRRMED